MVVDSTSLTADASKKRQQWDKNLVAHVEKISGQLDQEPNERPAEQEDQASAGCTNAWRMSVQTNRIQRQAGAVHNM